MICSGHRWKLQVPYANGMEESHFEGLLALEWQGFEIGDLG